MEEGPEPQELMEQVEENLHKKHTSPESEEEGGGGSHRSKHMRSAITAAVLAVLAAIGSLLSGHAANEAILLQTKASNQWSYYQAKSTKAHLYEVNKTLMQAFMHIVASNNNKQSVQPKPGEHDPLSDLSAQADAKMKGYEKEKTEIENKATELEKESAHAFGAHQMYSFGVACFQIGIVLASVSILVDSGLMYGLSITSGVIGVVLLIVGYVN
jgi:Domain of unknown function (DUF4337)